MTLRVCDIDTFYGTSHILHGVSLDMDAGDLFAVLGRNGAGKTTLMRSIIGVTPPRHGSIELDGVAITHLKPHERARLGIGYVPQGRDIIADISVAENIYIALLGVGRKARRVPEFVFDYFPALRKLLNQKGGTLSGGQQQQLAIARALVQEPKLLLMDEPTEGLQPSVVEEIDAIIKRIPEERRCAVLLVEQNLDFVRALTQKFAILDTGRIVMEGEIEKLTDQVVREYLQV